MLRLSKESIAGLQKLKTDISTLVNKRNRSEHAGTNSRFGFVDVIKICFGIIVAVGTIKTVFIILNW